MVNVTKANFLEQSNDLLQHLPTAAFIAIDEEMTGISVNGRPCKDDTPEQRYLKNKQVPEKYSIIQAGIALFHQHPDYPEGQHEFQVRRYNFYLFPPSNEEVTREVTLNPSSIEFLNQHNMDFNLWTKEGIPYVTSAMATSVIQKYKDHRRKHESKESTTVRDPAKRRVELSRTEDVNFHARAMASLREWIDSVGTTTFLLPACNGFLRRALYESIELEYPALICESAGPAHKDQIRVWRLSPEEKRQREELLQKEAWERMVMNVGFWRVFTAISNACRGVVEKNSIALAENVHQVSLDAQPEWESIGRNIPVVVHNGLMDLLFLMTHFHSHQLPDSYLEAKALIVGYFPLVYDTKVLSTECLGQSSTGDNTALGNLYSKLVENDELFDLPNQLQPVDAVGDNSTAGPDQLHEAAYDAFLTGAVFVALSKRIVIHNEYAGGDGTHAGVASLSHLLSNDADAKELFGRNKLYLMLTLYTIDLENPLSDPLCHGLSTGSTYRVAGIDPAVTTSDIVRCLSNLSDSAERRVNFEIVWVDDQTFMVAARHPSGNDETLHRHGQLILTALRRRFAVEDICTLEQHMAATSKAVEATEDERSWWSTFLGLFGYHKRKFDNMEGNEPKAKRRRTS